ncbi:TRAP transporter large permease [Avibacterium volantium]|uniref:TRAP transporter large permease protein n=1 Tax=Avibacterium volantium TaxID=762 RepID=A0A447SPA7_AVIVO|nr:TRAP transporter large permease subunit [Avibacterium volantium]VEB22903.1 Neu5Ac permease [Avibacterium volantium]
MSFLLLFLCLFLLILLGIPLYISILFSCIGYILLRGDIAVGLIIQQLYSGIDKYSLLAIPLYILAGNLICCSKIGERIVSFLKVLLSPFYGGAGIVTVLSALFFSLISGSAPATVLTVGKLMRESMYSSGYSKNFTLGLIISTGSLGIVIPPSIFLIVYGVVTNTSIKELFIYGAYTGFIFGSVFLISTIFYAWFNNIKSDREISANKFYKELKNGFLALLLPFIVILGISTGITSPTEAGIAILVYGLFLGFFVYKDLTIKRLSKIVLDSVKTTSQIMIIMTSASLLGWLLAESNYLDVVHEFFLGFESNVIPLILINILFLSLGMIIDITSLAVILSSVIMVISVATNIPLIAIGAIMAINGAIGMYTPPFGLSLFVAKEIGALNYEQTVKLLFPFYAISLFALILVNILVINMV